MQYWALLTIVGIQCITATPNVMAATCSDSADVRYFLNATVTKEIRFGLDQADQENSLDPEESNQTTPGPRQSHCTYTIATCRDCHLKVTLLSMRLASCEQGKTCRCNYVSIVEPEYEKSRRTFCGQEENTSLTYESRTKTIKLDFVFQDPSDSTFTIRVQSLPNVYLVQGHSNNYRGNRSGHLQSPHFPLGYPSDYSVEYHLCNNDLDGNVQLVFTDFQLSPWSTVTIEDTNRTSIHIFNGNVFRPPIVTSSGSNMTLKFKANDEYPNPGFRATYYFLRGHDKYILKTPLTECGGFVDDYGGTVSMTMANPDPLQGYDCVWIIRPRITDETHLSLRVVQFQDMGPKSELSIHKGLTSTADLLETLAAFDRYEPNTGPPTQEYVVDVETGFYLRFKGYFTNRSRLAVIYTAFKFEACIPNKDFRCNNGRCIKPVLHCDGFNHCGDGSDEVACYGNVGTMSPEDVTWWRTLTPNYYFPKTDGSGGGGTNTLILITSMAGLGMFVLTTALILVKLHKQRREDSSTRHMLRTVSADVDSSPRLSPTTAPPLYDPPPSYDDVIKFYLPPPPTYTSISGRDNGAFVPDSSPEVRVQHGRSVSALPQLLSVILPARVLNRNTSSPGLLKDNQPAFSLDLSLSEATGSRVNAEDSVVDLMDMSSPPEEMGPPPPYEPSPEEDGLVKCFCQGACSCSPVQQDFSCRPVEHSQQDCSCSPAELVQQGCSCSPVELAQQDCPVEHDSSAGCLGLNEHT